MYRFNAISIKILTIYSVDFDKLILNIIWRDKRPRTVNIILKENEFGELTLFDFKTYS